MPAAPKDRLPWPFTIAACVAVLALHLSSKTNDFRLPLLGGFIGAAWVTSARLPDSKILTWIIRVVIWVILILVSPPRHAIGASPVFEPDYAHLFGCFCAAELALRVWTRTATGPSRGETLLLTALVITAASNTYDRDYMRLLVPIYALLVILCLRKFSKQSAAPSITQPPTAKRPRLLALRATAAALALLIGFSVVFAVTRYEYGITSWFVRFTRNPSRQTEIGLHAAPHLQEIFNPQASLTRVLLIDCPRSERHLRALVYDTYADQRWRSFAADSTFHEALPADLKVPPPAGSVELRFTRLSDYLQLIPLPLQTASVRIDDLIKRNMYGSLRTERADPGGSYVATVPSSDTFQGPLCMPLDDADRERLLAISAQVDPKVIELARRVAGNDPDPLNRVRKLAIYLRATHGYALEYKPQGEPLSDFILNNRSAHCQYFASALVVMSRAADVPSRYVSGFYAHESYADDQMVVRDRDAHAWAECWIDGIGWITVDATPSAGLPDQSSQRPSKWRRLGERMQDLPRNVRNFITSIPAKVWTIGILSIAAAALLFALVRHLYLRRRTRSVSIRHRAYSDAPRELRDAARRFNRYLHRRQIPCPDNTTWREHLSPSAQRGMSVAPMLSAPAESLIDDSRKLALCFITTYEEARFGQVNGDTTKRLNELLNTLEQSS